MIISWCGSMPTSVLCWDTTTEQFFQSSKTAIEKARNDINARLIKGEAIRLSRFFQMIGLQAYLDAHDFVLDPTALIEVDFYAGLTEDIRPYLGVDYSVFQI